MRPAETNGARTERYDLRRLTTAEQAELERLLLEPSLRPAERARRDELLAKAELTPKPR